MENSGSESSMNPLIESVRALAEAQKNAAATELSGKTARQSELPAIAMRLMQQRERVCFIATEMDAPALLAALERAEKVKSAALECGAALSMVAPCYCSEGGGFVCTKCKAIKALNAALTTRPTGQAIMDELSAARKVCEIAQWQENGGLWPENYADALDAYRAARKANT